MPTCPVICIVDDDDYVRVSLGSLLRSYGYAIRLFESAETFLESQAASTIDCLVSDIQMPGMSGLQMYESLLSQGITPPVIFITAAFDDASRFTAHRLGAAGYLLKPFDGLALVAGIQSALRFSSPN